MTRHAVPVLFVCTALAPQLPASGATVALIPHFEHPPGPLILNWMAPALDDVFRPAGLSMEWYANPEAAPAHAARRFDVWFRGDCRPIDSRLAWNPPPESVRLGWVLSHQGRLGPDIVVDCDEIMMLAAGIRTAPNHALSEIVFLRLVERVLTHELLHLLFRSAGHGDSDFTRPRIWISDWARVGHLTPDEIESLRRLYGPAVSAWWPPR